MNNVKDMRFYKGISLFIKTIVLAASFYYIIQKISTSPSLFSSDAIRFTSKSVGCLLLAIVLVCCNWGLEARKWQVLISSFEDISWLRSFQSILTGVAFGIFTPNRVGEFSGRIFFLKKADKIAASLRSFFGSFVQLMITVIAGCIAVICYAQNNFNRSLRLQSYLDPQKKGQLLIFVLLVLLVAVAVFKVPYFAKWKHHFKTFLKIPRSELIQVIFLSTIRYFVFTLQFYLILIALGLNIEFVSALILIAITFLITSAVPTFALTEIVVRSAIAVSVFAVIETPQPEIAAAASFLLWVMNLAIPALIGSLFIGKLQFFKA